MCVAALPSIFLTQSDTQMAERMLRDWTQSESINLLSAEAERFFTRLIMKADDFGNYVGNTKLLKAALYPLKDKFKESNIESFIGECENSGVIISYEVDGKRYLNIPNYGQRMRQMRGKYPAFDGTLPTNVRGPRTNAGEEKGREVEGKGKGKTYGEPHAHFILVKSKYLSDQTARINGKAGLIAYMEENQTILNSPEYGDKFMRSANSKVFNELSHVQNAYSRYIEKQYK